MPLEALVYKYLNRQNPVIMIYPDGHRGYGSDVVEIMYDVFKSGCLHLKDYRISKENVQLWMDIVRKRFYEMASYLAKNKKSIPTTWEKVREYVVELEIEYGKLAVNEFRTHL